MADTILAFIQAHAAWAAGLRAPGAVLAHWLR